MRIRGVGRSHGKEKQEPPRVETKKGKKYCVSVKKGESWVSEIVGWQ